MLFVDLSVTNLLGWGKKEIGSIKIKNLGENESIEQGLKGENRVYRYSCKMNIDRKVSGKVIHDRNDGALILIQKVIDEIERKKVLKVLRSIKKDGKEEKNNGIES